MLKKTNRLTKAQFDHYFKVGKRTHTPTLQLIYTDSDEFHGAVVVGKKVYKKAVDRNRLRRRLYGALYRAYKRDNLLGAYIIITKPSAKELTQKTVAPVLEQLLIQAKNKS